MLHSYQKGFVLAGETNRRTGNSVAVVASAFCGGSLYAGILFKILLRELAGFANVPG